MSLSYDALIGLLNTGMAAVNDLANTQEHRPSFAEFTATSAKISESVQPAADAMTPELTQLNAVNITRLRYLSLGRMRFA